MPEQAETEKNILEILEHQGPKSVPSLIETVETSERAVRKALSELEARNLVEIDSGQVESESPVPLSKLAFRGELTPSQAVIKFLYEEKGLGQSEIARILDYSPGNIQTNLDRIEEKLGRELEQGVCE